MTKEAKDNGTGYEGSLDRGWAWVIMAATSCSFLVTGGLLYSTGLVQTALLERFGESRAKTTWAGSLYMSLSNLAGPLGAVLINRADCRTAHMVAGLLMASGFLMSGWASNLETCIIGCGAVAGTGSGLAYSVCFVIPGFNFRKNLNLVMGISIGAGGIGMFALSPLMEYVREQFGYQSFFVLLASISLQLVVVGALMRPSPLEMELKRLRGKTRNHNRRHVMRLTQSITKTMKFYSKVLLNKYVLCLALSLCLYNGGNHISYLVWPSFCLSKGLTTMQSALVLSVTGGVYILGRIITGFIGSNKFVDERILYSGYMMLQAAFLFLFQLYSNSYTGHLVSAVLLGLANGSPWVVLTTLNAKYIGLDLLSTASGIEFIFAGIGSLIIAAISGIMLDSSCTYEQIFMMCGGTLFIAGVVGIAPMLSSCNGKPKSAPDLCLEETGHKINDLMITQK